MPIEIYVALIAAFVALLGYLYNDDQNRRSKKFDLKTKAYAEFLGKVERILPEDKDQRVNNEQVKALNEALTVLIVYAPSNIVRKVNELANQRVLNRNNIKNIQAILHNDIHSGFSFSKKLEEAEIPHFPYNQ